MTNCSTGFRLGFAEKVPFVACSVFFISCDSVCSLDRKFLSKRSICLNASSWRGILFLLLIFSSDLNSVSISRLTVHQPHRQASQFLVVIPYVNHEINASNLVINAHTTLHTSLQIHPLQELWWRIFFT